MSVINKMLKDLESEREIEVTSKGNILLSKNNNNLFIIIVLILVIIVISMYFYGSVFERNLSNESSVDVAQKATPEQPPTIEQVQPDTTNYDVEPTNTKVVAPEKKNVQQLQVEPIKLSEKLESKPKQIAQKNITPQTKTIKPLNETKITEKKSKNNFKISKSKVDPKSQAKRYWSDAEKQPSNAEKLLTKALDLDGSLHGARLQLIALLISQKRLNDAERITDKGLILSPQNPAYIEWKARIRVAFNDAKTGLQWLLKITPEIRQHINYYGILASLASQLKYNDIAAETYLKLSKIQPKHGPWLLGMAISEERLGNIKVAKNYYQKAHSAEGLTPRARIFIQQKLNKLES